VTGAPTADDAGAAIVHRLRRAAPIVGTVDLARTDDGWYAVVRLDPVLVRARASQQELRDRSVAGAAASPRVHAWIADAVARVNAVAPDDQRIARFVFSRD
jgi:hypothetical protein